MTPDPRLESVRARLSAHKGQVEGIRIVEAALRHAGVGEQTHYSPQELLAIADALIVSGGYIELVGRNLKVQALQAGATLPKAPVLPPPFAQ